jgi:beta-glucosidase-like glycosyl hydrolase
MTAAVPNPDPATGQDVNLEPNADSDKPLGENGEKALRAERSRATAAEKRAAELEAQVKEFQDKGKSAEDKQAEAMATAARERDAATVRALRYEVCADMDLPLKSARFLTGSTKAEIEEAAKAFKELMGSKSAEKSATGLPASPNAGRDAKPSGGALGLEEAKRRWPAKTA